MHYPHKDNLTPLNYESLKLKYKSYFGLLLSKLYSSSPLESTSTRLQYQPGSLLSSLNSQCRRHKSTIRKRGLTIYNLGSKFNEFFLKLNLGGRLEPTDHKRYPNLHRELRFRWKPVKTSPSVQFVANPMVEKANDNNSLSYFRKYKELTLSDEQLLSYQRQFLAQPPRPITSDSPSLLLENSLNVLNFDKPSNIPSSYPLNKGARPTKFYRKSNLNLRSKRKKKSKLTKYTKI